MTDSTIKALHDGYDITPTRQDVLAFMEKFPLGEKIIHEKPLTKLKQDTIKQLIEGGLI